MNAGMLFLLYATPALLQLGLDEVMAQIEALAAWQGLALCNVSRAGQQAACQSLHSHTARMCGACTHALCQKKMDVRSAHALLELPGILGAVEQDSKVDASGLKGLLG
jgi:hypothetical protein